MSCTIDHLVDRSVGKDVVLGKKTADVSKKGGKKATKAQATEAHGSSVGR
jgi:hypothetical protein